MAGERKGCVCKGCRFCDPCCCTTSAVVLVPRNVVVTPEREAVR